MDTQTHRPTAEILQQARDALVLTNQQWKSLADSGDAGFWKAEEQDYYKVCEAAIAAIDALAVEATECENCDQLVRALREATESPTFMGEPVLPKRCAYCSQPMQAACPAREFGGECVPTLAATPAGVQPKDAAPVGMPGWKMVPIEPTPEMLTACRGTFTAKSLYAAMLDASPLAPGVKGD